MRPEISEFSYGFAVTNELIHLHGTNLTAAPIFPSLYQEGQPGGGWDVMLQRPGLPLFLQFKLSHCLMRSNAKEYRDGSFSTGFTQRPYYRMYIRSAEHSSQHEMLVDWEQLGNEVYYVAPAFHQHVELNNYFLNHRVTLLSGWFKPSWVGPLPDLSDHYVAFQIPGAQYFCSKSSPMDGDPEFKHFAESIDLRFRETGKQAMSIDSLSALANKMALISRISYERREKPSKYPDMDVQQIPHKPFKDQYMDVQQMPQKHPIEQIAFYSHVFFDLQLFIVSERQT